MNISRSEVAVEAILLYLVIVENTKLARPVDVIKLVFRYRNKQVIFLFFISQSFLTDI